MINKLIEKKEKSYNILGGIIFSLSLIGPFIKESIPPFEFKFDDKLR